MKLSVDTQHDSKEDIRKMVAFLQHLLDEEQELGMTIPRARPPANETATPLSTGLGALFNNLDAAPTPPANETTERKQARPTPTKLDFF